MNASRLAFLLVGALWLAGPEGSAQDAEPTSSAASSEDAEDLDTESLWVPPDDPDPVRIHRDFEIDHAAGRHERAALRAQWYWEHALEHSSSQVGVRLSFFLSDWFEFAQDYAPARDAIRKARATALQRVFSGDDVLHNFRDAVRLNSQFGDDAASVTLFEQALEQYPGLRAQLVLSVDDVLLELGEYGLWGAHASPQMALARARLTASSERCDHEQHGWASSCDTFRRRRSWAESSARVLVALRALGRTDEARAIEAQLAEWQLVDEFPEPFSEAREGRAPPPSAYPRPQPWTQESPLLGR